MGLKETQTALARLLTETHLRERFFADPEAVGRTLDLSPEETRQMLSLSAWQVESMARSLQSKRLGEIRKLLPRSCSALQGRLAPLFRKYAAGSAAPQGVHKHRDDAIAFADYLLQNKETHSPEFRRTLRWERDSLRAAGRNIFMRPLILLPSWILLRSGRQRHDRISSRGNRLV